MLDAKKDPVKEPGIVYLSKDDLDIKKAEAQSIKEIQDNAKEFTEAISEPEIDLESLVTSLQNGKNVPLSFMDKRTSKDIDLSEYGKYLFPEHKDSSYPFPFQGTLDKDRAEMQSNWEQGGYALARILPNTLFEFIGMVGNTLDIEDYANVDNEVGNWLNNWAQKQKQSWNEDLPIYRENPDTALNVGDFAWWMENGSALVESAAAFVGLGYLTGGGSLKALTSGGKALEWLKVLNKGATASNIGARTTHGMAGLSNMLMLNQAEGIGIATNVYNNIKEEKYQQYLAEGKDEETAASLANEEAAKRASVTLNANRANILLNATSALAFIKAPNLTNQVTKLPTLRRSLSRIGYEGIQEAGEETVNMYAENKGMYEDYTLDRFKRDVLTAEGAEQALLGFIGGAGQTAMTNAGRMLPMYKDNEGNRVSRNYLQAERYFAQEKENERWDALSKEEKIKNNTDVYNKSADNIALYRSLKDAQSRGDTATAETIKNTLLRNQAYDAFSTGTTKNFINIFEGISKLTPEEAEARELDKDTYVAQSNEAIKTIKALEKEYFKSQSYIDKYSVYENRADNYFLKSYKDKLKTALNTTQAQTIEDLEDLGIERDNIEIKDNNRIFIKNLKSLSNDQQNVIKNLSSFNEYKDILKSLTNVDKSIESNLKEYAHLTSDTYKKEVEKTINDVKKDIAKKKTEKARQKSQEVHNKTKNDKRAKFKEEVDNPPTPDPEVKTEGTVKSAGITFDFGQDNPEAVNFAERAQKTYDSNIPIESKIKWFSDVLKKAQQLPETEGRAYTMQFTKALEGLEEQRSLEDSQDEIKQQTTEKVDSTLEDLHSDLSTDESPSFSDKSEAINTRVNKMLKALDEMEALGIDVTNFTAVAVFAQQRLGKAKFIAMFDKFQSLYNLTNVSENPTKFDYEDIFHTTEEKEKIIIGETSDITNTLLSGLYDVTSEEYKESVNDVLKTSLLKEGYSLYTGDSKEFEGLKIVYAPDTLAYLAKDYVTNVKVFTTDKFNRLHFNVSKKDLDHTFNNTLDETVLDFNELNEGSQVTLKVLDEVIYKDGTIAYGDGRLEQNGKIISKDPIENAPIGVIYKGKVVKGLFLHLPKWINESTIADANNVEKQQAQLRHLRETIINTETGSLNTVIKARSNGHLMLDVNNELSSVKENLPKARLAVGKDNMLNRADNLIYADNLNEINDGWTYAYFKVNKNNTYAVPLYRKLLNNNPEIVNSIINVVELYLNNDPNDPRVKDLFEALNINILTIDGLRKYASRYLYLNPNIDFKYSAFKSLMEGASETQAVVRIAGDNLEFGMGMNIDNSIGYINRVIVNSSKNREALVRALTSKLRTVLENSRLNVNTNLLGNSFDHVLIGKDVTKTTLNYEDFIKENTFTNIYSIELENGTQIYTAQANLKFNTSFAFEETTKEQKKSTQEDIAKQIIEDSDLGIGLNNLEDYDTDVELSPIVLKEDQITKFKEKTPPAFSIQGVSLPLQTEIIDHLTYSIIKDAVKNKYGNLSLDHVKLLKTQLDNAIDVLDNRIDSVEEGDTKRLNTLRKAKAIINGVVDNYGILTNLVLDRLRSYNNLRVNGKSIEFIKKVISTDEETEFDLIDILEDNKEDTSSWNDMGTFMQDSRNKLSIELKNFLTSIEDVAGFKDENGVTVAIPKTSNFFSNMAIPVPFDRLYNEISGILAYSNFETTSTISEPSFENMIAILDEWVDAKPFLFNVIKELKNADETIKNQFVTAMSKHYTNHVYGFKNKKGKIIVGNSDGNAVVRVIQQHWYNNIVNSSLIEINEDKEYIYNEEEINRIEKEVDVLMDMLRTNTSDDTVIPKATQILTDLGFDFGEGLVKDIRQNGIQYSKTPYSLIQLFGNADGVFKVFLKNLKKFKNSTLEEHHPFSDNTALNKFTRVIARRNPVYFATSFRDVRGRLYWSYSNNKFIIDRIKDLKTNKELINKLASQPYSKNSDFVKALVKEDKTFLNHFQYFTIDGLNFTYRNGKKLNQLTPVEYEELKMGFFFSQNKKGKDYIVNMYYPTLSDSAIQYGLKFIGTKYSDMLAPQTGYNLTPAMVDLMFDKIVQPEIDRILIAQKSTESKVEGYENGSRMFLHIPTLNALPQIWTDEHELHADVNYNTKKKELMKENFKAFLNRTIKQKFDKWKDYGFAEEKEEYTAEGKPYVVNINKNTNNILIKDVIDYTFNYLVGKVNVYQTFTTDPANYWKSSHWKTVVDNVNKAGFIDVIVSRDEALKYYDVKDWVVEQEDTFDNMGKRRASDKAPGLDITDSMKSMVRIAVLSDRTRTTDFIEEYRKLIKDIDYDFDGTDAQEFTTLEEHLTVMNKKGEISTKEMNRLLRQDNSGQMLSAEDRKIVLNPHKLVGVYNIWENGIERRLYVKSASFPLLKTLTKGLEIDKLRVAMVKQKIDRVAFASAVKVGAKNINDIWGDNGAINITKLKTIKDDDSPILRQGMKIQQEIPYKPYQLITDGTQNRKLLTANFRGIGGFKVRNKEGEFTGQQIQDEIDKTYNRIYRIKYNELLLDLDYDVINNEIRNTDKLQEIIISEGIARKYNINELKGLRIIDGKFETPLWLNSVSSKIEPLLNSIVDNKIRKLKFKGNSYTLGTSEGFYPIKEGKEATEYMRNNTNIIYDKDWFNSFKEGETRKLRPIRTENGVVQPDEVLVPFKITTANGDIINMEDYVETTPEGKFIDTNKLPKDLLEGFGYRIPTSGNNLMTYFKIVGFLPEASGDLLLAPSEWAVRMGSDFDADKLFSYLYNIEFDKTTKKLSRYNGKDELLTLQDYLTDLRISVMSNPNKAVQSEIIRGVSYGDLVNKSAETDLVREIYPYVDKSTTGIGLTEEYETFKYKNARAGEVGIGIFSNDSTFNALLRNTGIKLIRQTEEGEKNVVFYLGKRKGNTLSDPRTITGKKYKSQVIEAFQTLSVDNENEQGLHKLNINKYTFNVIKSLIFSGFDERMITIYINQPIIRRYVELKERVEDTAIEFTEQDLNQTIEKEFPMTGDLSADDDLDFDTMYENIKNPPTTTAFYNNQRLLLLRFNSRFFGFDKYGKVIKALQSTVNTDSAGIGKDLFYAVEKENQVLDLPLRNNVYNAHKLLGEYITLHNNSAMDIAMSNDASVTTIIRDWLSTDLTQEERLNKVKLLLEKGYVPISSIKKGNKIQNVISFLKPTNISGFATAYGLLLNNSLWSKYFPYNEIAVKEITRELTDVLDRPLETIADKAALNKTIFNSIKSFLITKKASTFTTGTILDERRRLFLDTKENISLANIIKTLREEGKLDNEFINRLTFDINKEVLFSNIVYRANMAENVDERGIFAAFTKMFLDTTPLGVFNDIKYTPQIIAQDLVTHQLISGGVQKANQFIKYIPLSYLQSIGYYDEMDNIEFNNEDEFNTSFYKHQYLQHNPKEVLLSDTQREYINGTIFKFYNDATIVRRNSEIEDVYLPQIFSIKDDTSLKGYKIYFFNSDSNQWEQKDTLGHKDILEYNADLEFGKSSLSLNKVKEVTNIKLPKDIKEIDVTLKLTTPKETKKGEVIYDPITTSITEKFGLNSQDTSSKKLLNILSQVVTNNNNPLRSYIAQELGNNIDKIKDYRLVIDNNLPAQGQHSIYNKTIYINPTEIDTEEDFEDTIIEETIHAFTKKAIVENKTGEILRLKGLRKQAEDAVRKHLGGAADIKFNTVRKKIAEKIAMNREELDLIYPVINDEEFIGRLFRSTKLQSILNETTVKGDKSILTKIFDFIKSLFDSLGINVKDDSVLAYAITDTISLIKQPPPSSSIQAEIQKKKNVTRTVEWVEKRLKLRNDDGTFAIFDDETAEEHVEWINTNISNLEAVAIYGAVRVFNRDDDLRLNNKELAPKDGSLLSPVLLSLNNRIDTLTKNIDKAERRNEQQKAEQLREQLTQLIEKRNNLLTKSRIIEAATIGKQDMQEIEEMFRHKVTIEDALYIRKIVNFWKTSKDTLLEERHKKSDIILKMFDDIISEAIKHEVKLETIENNYMENLLNKYGVDMSIEDIFLHFKDINGLEANVLDISRVDNPMLSSIFLHLKKTNIRTTDEVHALIKEIDKIEAKTKKALKARGDKELYDVFRQRTANGKLTGHLINRYSHAFYKDLKKYLGNVRKNGTETSYAMLINWAKDNTKNINLHYIVPENVYKEGELEKAETYKTKLKEELGENHYNEFIEEQTKMLNAFHEKRKGYLRYLITQYSGAETIEEVLEIKDAFTRYAKWLITNSPYVFYKQYNKDKIAYGGTDTDYRNINYVKFIPTKDSYYENNFKVIENDKELFDFYNYFDKIDKELRQYLPTKDKIGLAINGIPHIDKVLLEQYQDKGMKAGLLPIWDAMKTAVRKNEEGIVDYTNRDPVTETEEKELGVNLTRNNSQAINDYIALKRTEYFIKYPKAPEKEVAEKMDTWREEIVDKLAQKKSYDLPKVLRVYALTTIAFKHKAQIEDTIKLAQNVFNRQKEYLRNNRGELMTDEAGRYRPLNPAQSFKNAKKQFDYFIDTYYGDVREDEGVTTSKVLTSEDKAKQREINNLLVKLKANLDAGIISQEDYDTRRNGLEQQLDRLGGVAVWSRRGDALLKYIQLKGMGWNIMSGLANIGFGYISNIIEGSGGQVYTSNQLYKAYGMVMNSVLRNTTFNKVTTSNAVKIRSLMDKWDVLKDASKELFQSPMTIVTTNKTKWLAPYNLVQRAEYVNQAPVMIAMMFNKKYKVGDKEIDLWEAFDENGEWKVNEYGEEPTELISNFRIALDQTIKMNHGNYDPVSALAVKQKFVGRALSQFRSWMYEGFAIRWEKEKYDKALNLTRKGRYRSLGLFYKNRVGNAEGILEGLKGVAEGTSSILKGFVRSATFGKVFSNADFSEYMGEDFSATDVANMRKVMTELLLLVSIYNAHLMLTLAAANLDDEEDKNKLYITNLLFNQGLRLKMDILLYLNPTEFKNILRDLIPATSIISDFIGWTDSVGKFIQGEDTIERGVYSGHSRFLRETAQMLPFGTQIYKNINYSIQTFDK